MKHDPIPGTLVIGLGYRARHGKDFAASVLAARLGIDVHRFAYSDPISAVARVVHGMTTRDPRLLQDIGYSARRLNPSVWNDAVYGAIADRRPRLALITGVRFPDEAQLVRDMGGYVVHVRRRNRDGSEYVAADRPADHPTEHGLDGFAFDYTIENVTGMMIEFEDRVMTTYSAICARVESVAA